MLMKQIIEEDTCKKQDKHTNKHINVTSKGEY